MLATTGMRRTRAASRSRGWRSGGGCCLGLWLSRGDHTVAPSDGKGSRQPHVVREVGRFDNLTVIERFLEPLPTDVKTVPPTTALARGARSLPFGSLLGSHLVIAVVGFGHLFILWRRFGIRHASG